MGSIAMLMVALLFLRMAWRAWKRTLRDEARDALFDLRDEWREFFIRNNLPMTRPEYANAREMINRYLQYTSGFRFVGLMYYAAKMPSSAVEECARRIDERLKTDDERIAGEIARIRRRAATSVQKYMLFTTLLILPLGAIATFTALCGIMDRPWQKIRGTVKSMTDAIPPLGSGTIEIAAYN